MKKYRSFNEARELAHSLKLKDQKQWFAYCKSSKKPNDIPQGPHRVYKNKGWKGFGDWLGTGNLGWKEKHELTRNFGDARKFVHSLKLKNVNEWREYTKSGKKPDDIPATPNTVYKSDGWISMGDWLGTGNIASHLIQYRNFEDARKFARSLHLKTWQEWDAYCKSGKKPNDIPSGLYGTYKKEFKGIGDWLGTGNIASFNRKYRSFEEARKFVRKLGIKTYDKYREYKDHELAFLKEHLNKGKNSYQISVFGSDLEKSWIIFNGFSN